jgi:hypothetical protein
MIGFPDWQVAVETSQVIAGLVRYPTPSPFFLYHIKLWTILHQLIAPLLLLGVTEIRLSLIISGLLGMVTFQALSMVVYALSGDALLSVGAAVLIFFTRAAEYGAVYGLFLLGTENTYGILGLSFCVLSIAIFGSGWYRTGAFLIAVAPAVHPSLGLWSGVLAASALLPDLLRNKQDFARASRWFLAGCGITLLSLATQALFIVRAPHPPGGESFTPQEIAAFITYWDGHRKPVDLANNGVSLNLAALGMAAVWLVAFRETLSRPSLLLLRFAIVSALVSVALVFVSRLPPATVPTFLLVLMPGRVLNFDAMIYAALVTGLLANYRRFWSGLLLLALFTGLSIGDHSMLWEWIQEKRGATVVSTVRPLWVVTFVSIGLLTGALWEKFKSRPAKAGPDVRVMNRPYRLARGCALLLLLVITGVTMGFARPRSLIFHDRTNDVFFGQVASASGVLLTAGDLHLIQLKTRRPVLLDGGGLDGVMYSLDAGPEMKRILRDVYGVDLLNPPDEARGAGRIPPLANQKVWEAYSLENWQEIGRTYGVTQVLTYPDWTLQLPLAAESRRLLLYQIPPK